MFDWNCLALLIKQTKRFKLDAVIDISTSIQLITFSKQKGIISDQNFTLHFSSRKRSINSKKIWLNCRRFTIYDTMYIVSLCYKIVFGLVTLFSYNATLCYKSMQEYIFIFVCCFSKKKCQENKWNMNMCILRWRGFRIKFTFVLSVSLMAKFFNLIR